MNNGQPIPLLSKEHFAQTVYAKMVAAGKAPSLLIDANDLCLVSGQIDVLTLYDVYQEYQEASPEISAALLRRTLRVWFSSRRRRIPVGFETALEIQTV